MTLAEIQAVVVVQSLPRDIRVPFAPLERRANGWPLPSTDCKEPLFDCKGSGGVPLYIRMAARAVSSSCPPLGVLAVSHIPVVVDVPVVVVTTSASGPGSAEDR